MVQAPFQQHTPWTQRHSDGQERWNSRLLQSSCCYCSRIRPIGPLYLAFRSPGHTVILASQTTGRSRPQAHRGLAHEGSRRVHVCACHCSAVSEPVILQRPTCLPGGVQAAISGRCGYCGCASNLDIHDTPSLQSLGPWDRRHHETWSTCI
jgi:hypothetical protein